MPSIRWYPPDSVCCRRWRQCIKLDCMQNSSDPIRESCCQSNVVRGGCDEHTLYVIHKGKLISKNYMLTTTTMGGYPTWWRRDIQLGAVRTNIGGRARSNLWCRKKNTLPNPVIQLDCAVKSNEMKYYGYVHQNEVLPIRKSIWRDEIRRIHGSKWCTTDTYIILEERAVQKRGETDINIIEATTIPAVVLKDTYAIF